MSWEEFINSIWFKYAYKAYTPSYPVIFYYYQYQTRNGQIQEIYIEFKYDQSDMKLIKPLSHAHGEPYEVDCPLCGRSTGGERDYIRCKVLADYKYQLMEYLNQQDDPDLMPSETKTLNEMQSK